MTVYFLSPQNDEPFAGGSRKLYRFADILNEAGKDAAIVQGVRGFRPRGFDFHSRIEYPDLRISDRDILAVPEILGPKLGTMAPGIPRVSINQGVYATFTGIVDPAEHPYLTSPHLLGVMVVSEASRGYLEYGFPRLDVTRVHNGIDPTIFFPNEEFRSKRIAFMPRKRGADARQALALLSLRGALRDWSVEPIAKRPLAEVGCALRRSAVFISLSEQEGWGLPPVEALACGCRVVGYTGIGGREFFDLDHCVEIEHGDVVGLAKALEREIEAIGPTGVPRAKSQQVLETYSPGREADDILAFFSKVEDRMPVSTGRTTSLTQKDTWGEAPTPVAIRMARKAYREWSRRAGRRH